ncbi:MAG: hypothetical protein ACRCW2_10525 [Cellulosilyticaceae bacterium]
MQSLKYLRQMVLRYLPPGVQLLQIKPYYDSPSLLEGDIDGDGNTEVIVVYNNEKSNYIGILKNYGRYLELIWNSKINLVELSVFEMVRLKKQEGQCILLGGKTKEEQSIAYLLEWQKGKLGYMLEEGIAFDKLYCEDLEPKDGIDELIIWKHSYEEAYDVAIFVYENHSLIETDCYNKEYSKRMKQYYTYLYKNYPQDRIYQKYLIQAQKACQEELDEEEFEVDEEQCMDGTLELLNSMVGYIEEEDVEENICLIGKKYSENEVEFIESLKLNYTTGEQSKWHLIVLADGPVRACKLFLGDFTKNGREDVFVQMHDAQEHLCGGIYVLQAGILREILSLRNMEKHGYEVTCGESGSVEITRNKQRKFILDTSMLSGTREDGGAQIGAVIKAYAVDEEHLEQYTLYCVYPIIYSQSKTLIGYFVRCLGYEDGGFQEYKAYVTYRL